MLTRIHSPRRSCAAQRRRRPSPRKRFTACRGIGCKAGWSGIVARPMCRAGGHPAFDQSEEGKWEGIGGHGRKDLRAVLIEAAHSILRSREPVARWGKRLMARKGSLKLAVAALARKLAVSVWYLMMGRWSQLEEVDQRLSIKVCKIVSQVRPEAIQQSGSSAKALRQKTKELMQAGRGYVLA